MPAPRSNGSIHSLTARDAAPKLVPVATPGEWTLDAGRPHEIVDRLLDRPDAAKVVRATPVQPLFLFIKALGLADATGLLQLCSTEQVQAFLDLDCWQGDRLVPARVYPWVEALLELGYAKLTAHTRRLDPQFLTTFLAPQLRIYELTTEEPPDDPQGLPLATPDRFFLVDIVPSVDDGGADVADRQNVLQRWVEDLYRGDLDLARVLLTSAKWDGGTETEEQAYRFRSARMADLGYIDYYEALKVYMLVDPLKVPPVQPLVVTHAVPADGKVPSKGGDAEPVPVEPPGLVGPRSAVWRQLAPSLGERDFTFGRAVDLLTEAEQSRLLEQLMLLCNQAMAADKIELGDFEGTQHTLRRAVGYLAMGLEFRLRPVPDKDKDKDKAAADSEPQPVQLDPQRAAQVLREVPLLYLFRLGYSLTLQLRKLATLLLHSGATTLVPKLDAASLLMAEHAEPLRALLAVRPLYSLKLDPPGVAPRRPSRPEGEPGQGTRRPEVRPFQSLRDLGRAARLLEFLSALDKLMTIGLGLRRDTLHKTLEGKSPPLAEVKLHDLVGTMVSNLLLDRPPSLVPLPRRDLPTLRWRGLGEAAVASSDVKCELRPEVTAKVMATLQERVRERSLNETEEKSLWTTDLQDFIRASLSRLATGLAALPPTLDDAHADLLPTVLGVVLGR